MPARLHACLHAPTHPFNVAYTSHTYHARPPARQVRLEALTGGPSSGLPVSSGGGGGDDAEQGGYRAQSAGKSGAAASAEESESLEALLASSKAKAAAT